jgi:hypothetical protein
VVNISYGSLAGPHDGSSLIERAMDALLAERKENIAIVLAAGNGRRLACHTSSTVRHAKSALLRLNLVPGDTTDSFVELWYQPPSDDERVQVRARRSGEKWSSWVEPGVDSKLMNEAGSQVVAEIFHQQPAAPDPSDPPASKKRALVLLAIRPTERPADDDGPLAEPGEWEIEMALTGSKATDTTIAVDAWFERDDMLPFSGLSQSSFVGLGVDDANNTLSSIATGKHTVVVGGFRVSDGRVVDYSSLGPRRPEQLPLYYAACELDETERGFNAAAVRSSEVLKMNGTSVAAPVMARRLANKLARSRKPIAFDQWKSVIDQLAQTDEFLRPSVDS